jgi:hypothetical protein
MSVALANKSDGDNAKRDKGVELVVIGGDDLPAQVLSQHDAKAVGKRNSSPCLEPPYTLLETAAHVATLYEAVGSEASDGLASVSHVGCPKRIVIDFTQVQ